MKASEKIADIYFQYADTLDVNLLTDNRPGFIRMGLSYLHILVRDEMMRRLQEQGKFPPGLPSQDFIESYSNHLKLFHSVINENRFKM